MQITIAIRAGITLKLFNLGRRWMKWSFLVTINYGPDFNTPLTRTIIMLPGETIATGAENPCPVCNTVLVNEVLHSPAGYYIGTQCKCGPYSRESGYYRTSDIAQWALDHGGYERT